MSTEIFLTTWDRPQFVERSIKAIKANTLSDHRLIVIDNGSKQPTVNLLQNLKNKGLIDRIYRLPYNRGLEYARQTALDMATTDRIVMTDSDCLPHKPLEGVDWLWKLNDLMDHCPEHAAIACRTQIMIGSGDIFGENPPEVVDFTCGGSLRLMDTNLTRNVGGWEPTVEGRGNEEHKICGRFREVGLKHGFASYIPCYHLFGEENWGYDKDLKPEDTGHRDIGNLPQDDEELIKEEYETEE